ncbi:hypothetical protein ACFFTQ_25970 [Streptomyces roseofulvus]
MTTTPKGPERACGTAEFTAAAGPRTREYAPRGRALAGQGTAPIPAGGAA